MCYEYPYGLITILVMSIVLNFILGFNYVKLKGMYDEVSRIVDDVVKIARKTGRVK